MFNRKPDHPEFDGFDLVRVQIESDPPGEVVQRAENVTATITGPRDAVLAMVDVVINSGRTSVLDARYGDTEGNEHPMPGWELPSD